MNPTTVDPDLAPMYDTGNTLPNAPINPQPNLNDPVVLVRLLREWAQGLRMEAEAASPIGNQCGCANPAYLFGKISEGCVAAARMIESGQPKPAPVETPSTESVKPEPVKPGKK